MIRSPRLVEMFHLGLADLDALAVAAGIEGVLDLETGVGGRGADEFDPSKAIRERPASPVPGDVEEQPVLDLVPLRCGMTGDYDSVIGMAKEELLRRFTRRTPDGRFKPAPEPATLCGGAADVDPHGLTKAVAPVRIGGLLSAAGPGFRD
jgi:YmdB-like protein